MVPPKHVGAPQTIKKQKAVSNRYIHPTKNHKSVTKKEGPRKEKGPPWAPVPPHPQSPQNHSPTTSCRLGRKTREPQAPRGTPGVLSEKQQKKPGHSPTGARQERKTRERRWLPQEPSNTPAPPGCGQKAKRHRRGLAPRVCHCPHPLTRQSRPAQQCLAQKLGKRLHSGKCPGPPPVF